MVARGEVVSIGPIAAAGARVDAVRLRVRAAFTGRVTGGYVMDSWLRRSDGLLLRRTFESETRVRSAVGTVPARERYTPADPVPAAALTGDDYWRADPGRP